MIRKDFYIFILFLCCSTFVHAQMMNMQKQSLIEAPKFRTAFIRQNHIKELDEKVSSKMIGDIIRSKNYRDVYSFDTSGHITKQFKIMNLGYGKFDTSKTSYFYDENYRIERIVYGDKNGAYAYQFQYDSLNRVVKKSYIRLDDFDGDSLPHPPGKFTVISSEAKKYNKISALQNEVITYNNSGRQYKKAIFTYDKYGYLRKEVQQFIFGDKRLITKYNYNQNGWLSKKISYENSDSTISKYQYDKVGNILQEDVYEDTVHTTIREFLYRKQTFVMYAILEKDVPSKVITIREFNAKFYPMVLIPISN